MPMPTLAVEHATLCARDIDPLKNGSFSPNFARWMKTYGHFYRGGGTSDGLWRVKPNTRLAATVGFLPGTLMLGMPSAQHEGDQDFSGCRVLEILVAGSSAPRSCYTGAMLDLEAVPGFWEEYLRIGRCAIDPDHQESFQGNQRFEILSDGTTTIRTCRWCGHKQTQVLTPRTVFDESWVAL